MTNAIISNDLSDLHRNLIEKYINLANKRYLSELMSVLHIKEEQLSNLEDIAYYMCRDAVKEEDIHIFKKHDIRFDITVIPPQNINGEYIKTLGHYHPLKTNEENSYSEYYEVLQGNALYLLQKVDKEDILEFIAIIAKQGEKVYIPPNYGHVTINIGTETLIMSNLVERNFQSEYNPVIDKKGFGYYCIEGNGGFELIANTEYKTIVTPLIVKAPDLEQPIKGDKDLYSIFIEDPYKFQFLR